MMSCLSNIFARHFYNKFNDPVIMFDPSNDAVNVTPRDLTGCSLYVWEGNPSYQGTIRCTPNKVPMVFIGLI